MKSFIRFLLLTFFACALLSGCNTARGIGEDIQHLGNAIERAAS
ncbi:MAG TPA: entericidin, EcnA/B family [Franconibacter helveticus]|nr:entericidin A/B family lipoprotein [Franconibacter helveticus]MDU6924553.1 entericidin A/B family lipoprotein [Franconibacter helveticus]HAZ53961.1 entericidin, EcnA/B family [Franconibacter helveticus]